MCVCVCVSVREKNGVKKDVAKVLSTNTCFATLAPLSNNNWRLIYSKNIPGTGQASGRPAWLYRLVQHPGEQVLLHDSEQ